MKKIKKRNSEKERKSNLTQRKLGLREKIYLKLKKKGEQRESSQT